MNKKNDNYDPFENLVLDECEKEIEDSIDTSKFVLSDKINNVAEYFEAAAENHTKLHNSKIISIRINTLDLIKLKAKAKTKNMPYQTLLGTLVHEYVEGNTKVEL